MEYCHPKVHPSLAELSLEELTTNTPKVGILNHFKKGVEVEVEGADQEFEMWAYPDGIKIYDHTLTIINDAQPQHSFGQGSYIDVVTGDHSKQPRNYTYSFVHTDYSLNRKYYSALCWHVTLPQTQQKKYIRIKDCNKTIQKRSIYENSLPKCTLWQLQNNPQLINADQTLVYLPRVLIIGSSRPLFIFEREMLKFYYRNVIAETSDPLVRKSTVEYFKDLVYVAGYPRAEIEFDIQTDLVLKAQYIAVNKKNLDIFYTSCMFLPKLNQKNGSIQVIDCPNSSVKFSSVDICLGSCFEGPNVDLLGTLKRIGLKNFITLWKCLILQRHILVFLSMNSNTVIDLFQSLLYVTEPVKWENIYIPFLPFHLISSIQAIQSYLIGISKIHMDYVIDHYKHQMKDIVIFDLDDNLLIQNAAEPLQLPTPINFILTERLKHLGFCKDRSFLTFFRNTQQIMNQLDKIFKIKRIFFDALIYLFNNYRPFATLREEDLLNFDREGYLSIFKDMEWRQFSERLTETMIFTRLCEYHLYQQKILRWNQSNFGGLFVYCQNIIAQKTPKKAFWKLPLFQKGSQSWQKVPYYDYFSYVLTENMENLSLRKKNYQIQKYLVKYMGWMHMQQEDIQLFKQRDNNNENNSYLRGILQFLLPWLKEVQIESQDQDVFVDSSIQLLNLECLFRDSKKSNEQNQINSNQILKELKMYRQHKNRLVTFIEPRKVNRELRRIKERISV